jgi:hypothetical protein
MNRTILQAARRQIGLYLTDSSVRSVELLQAVQIDGYGVECPVRLSPVG